MRTTITLDPDVEKLIRDAMARGRRSFKAVVNEALRRGLGAGAAAAEAPFVVEARPMDLRPGIDPARVGEIDDDLEQESYRRKLEALHRHQVHDRS